MEIIHTPSPNFDDRKDGQSPSMIILHYTGTQTAEEARDIFVSHEAAGDYGRVSPHYMIDGAGTIYKFVDENKRAWHAGRASWGECMDINSASIGIEIWNTGHEFDLEDYLPVQMSVLIDLIKDIRSRWSIPDKNILGHSDIACGRKFDPGEKFPWAVLAEAGIGVMPSAISPLSSGEGWGEGQFFEALRTYGYTYTDDRQTLLTEFRRHFLPHLLDGDGVTDEDIQALIDISGKTTA